MGLMVEKNGVVTGSGQNGASRDRLNFTEGAGIKFTIADGTDSTEAQVTVNVGGASNAPVNVTGAKGGNAALTSLIAALVALGLITDGTS